jgi:hypothetical protein
MNAAIRRFVVPATIAALLMTAPQAWAQATAITGQIEGVVSDTTGASLPGVIVTARNVDTGFVRESVSNGEGFYRLNLLPLGAYEVTVALQGFATVKRTGLNVRVNETLTVAFDMKPSTITEVIQVVAEAPVVEVTRSLSSNTLNQFRYDAAAGQYIYNLSTKSLSLGANQLTASFTGGVPAITPVTITIK